MGNARKSVPPLCVKPGYTTHIVIVVLVVVVKVAAAEIRKPRIFIVVGILRRRRKRQHTRKALTAYGEHRIRIVSRKKALQADSPQRGFPFDSGVSAAFTQKLCSPCSTLTLQVQASDRYMKVHHLFAFLQPVICFPILSISSASSACCFMETSFKSLHRRTSSLTTSKLSINCSR